MKILEKLYSEEYLVTNVCRHPPIPQTHNNKRTHTENIYMYVYITLYTYNTYICIYWN